MVRGTIMFFSQSGCVANLWCPEAEAPLVTLRQDDFAEQWPQFKVGVAVQVELGTDGQTVRQIEICDGE